MEATIAYASEKFIPSFYEALSLVAQERIYIEMIAAPAFEQVAKFQRELIAENGAVYYAIQNEKVVGWCDLFPEKNPRFSHRGSIGMGLLPAFRGKGLGLKLLESVLAHAKGNGLEKAELHVYTSNLTAIALYKKCGFVEEGLLKKYRKLDGQYFDCLMMGKFLR